MTKPVKYMPSEPTWNQIEAAIPFLSKPADTPDRQRRVIRDLYLAMWEIAPEPKSSHLPRRQAEVQLFLAQYLGENNKPPTYEEIAIAVGMNNRQEAYQAVRSMERRGILKRAGTGNGRALKLLVYPGDPVPNPFRREKGDAK